jgi:hypothetical protein
MAKWTINPLARVAPDPLAPMIRTPDQRLRVFISSTLGELAPERLAVKAAIERLHLAPVMFEDGARPHPPRTLYRAYLAQSHVFLGIYWQRYGWIAEGEEVSGLEDEYRLAGDRPRLLYIKEPAQQREERLSRLFRQFQTDDAASYKRFGSNEELVGLVERDLALLLSERFVRSPVPCPSSPCLDRALTTALLPSCAMRRRLWFAAGTGRKRRPASRPLP